MSSYLKDQSDKHTVKHLFSKKNHFYEVKSGNSKEIRNVMLQTRCDCPFMGVIGIPNGKICSHVLAVLKQIVKDNDIRGDDYENRK